MELGQPQSERELKTEHNKVIGTQCMGGSHIYRAVLQVVIQLLKIRCLGCLGYLVAEEAGKGFPPGLSGCVRGVAES